MLFFHSDVQTILTFIYTGLYLGRGIAGFPQNTQSFPQYFDIDAVMIPQIIESFPHIVGGSAGSIFV